MGHHSDDPRGAPEESEGATSQTFYDPHHDAERATRMIHKGCPILAREEWPRWLGEGEETPGDAS